MAAVGLQDRSIIAFDSSLRLLPKQAKVQQDEEIFLWGPDTTAGRGMPPGFRAPSLGELPNAQVMTPEARRRVLQEQAG